MKLKHSHHNEELKRFNPSIEEGLSSEDVSYMKSVGKINTAKNPTNKSYGRIIFDNVFTFFNILMFAIAGILLLIVGPQVVTNLMFLGIIISNLLIGTIQECKSKHTIEKLKLLNDSKVKVKRNGKEEDILPSEVVLDDIVILSPGDQIPADSEILEESILEVNESLLTGESIPVKKSKGDMIYAGSFVVSGSLAVRVDKVGNDTYIQSIENKAKISKAPKSRLMLAIRKIIRTMSLIAIPLAIIVLANEMIHTINNNTDNLTLFPSFWGEDTILSRATFYSGVTIAYMIPCGMALLASVAMATGVVRLAQEKTLVQDLYSVESLSRVNTLCLDKTGTLTDGTMTLEKSIILDKSYDDEKLEQLMSSYLSAFNSVNQTSTALLNKYGKLVQKVEDYGQQSSSKALMTAFNYKHQLNVTNKVNFSSARKYSAVEFEKLGWFVMGAPEYITKDEEILNQVNEYAKSGLRVILLAKTDGVVKDEEPLPSSKHHVAMFIISDTIRPEVKDTMLWFRENDVDIKVISGDNIGTVSYIAKQSGIANYDKVIDMSKITPEDDLNEIVMNNTIFGRVSPDQKAEIIAILKQNGRVVGVTGDGLNDLLAFKQADCSIALANGAAATKNVANMVLLDSNFSNMKEAVFQGRRVVNNIQRSSSLFVMKDYLWLFITIMPILLGLPHMIQPTVMSVVNIFITGIASLFVALEPDKTRVTGNFYKNVTKKAIVAGFYMFLPVLLITLYLVISRQFVQGITLTELEPMFKTTFVDGNITAFGWIPVMALCVTISGFIIFFRNCRPFTKFRKILYIAILALVLLILYLAPEFFIISGTDMLKEAGGVAGIFPYIFSHLVPNATLALFRTMTLEQAAVLGAYLFIAIPLYLLNEKVFGSFIEYFLFSPRDYKDE